MDARRCMPGPMSLSAVCWKILPSALSRDEHKKNPSSRTDRGLDTHITEVPEPQTHSSERLPHLRRSSSSSQFVQRNVRAVFSQVI